jgi:hypothetical protein
MFGGRFGVFHMGVVTGCAALWRIFSSNKSVPANMKKGLYSSRLPKNEKNGLNFFMKQNTRDQN